MNDEDPKNAIWEWVERVDGKTRDKKGRTLRKKMLRQYAGVARAKKAPLSEVFSTPEAPTRVLYAMGLGAGIDGGVPPGSVWVRLFFWFFCFGWLVVFVQT